MTDLTAADVMETENNAFFVIEDHDGEQIHTDVMVLFTKEFFEVQDALMKVVPYVKRITRIELGTVTMHRDMDKDGKLGKLYL